MRERIDYCEHGRYKAIRRPTVPCPNCWRIWFANHKDAAVTGNDILMVMLAVERMIETKAFDLEESIGRLRKSAG